MITVKIPVTVRDCSPVVSLEDGRFGVVLYTCPAGTFGSEALAVVLWKGSGDLNWDHELERLSTLALNISDPTGAAHLAWWLLYQTPSRTPAQHAERLEAIGWTTEGYRVNVDRAARGLPADLERLADYAHRVAGVTNG